MFGGVAVDWQDVMLIVATAQPMIKIFRKMFIVVFVI